MTPIEEALRQCRDALVASLEYTPSRVDKLIEPALAAADAVLAQPDKDYPCRTDGRCQYAIDHGAEDLGHCPRGKCVMPEAQPAPEPVAKMYVRQDGVAHFAVNESAQGYIDTVKGQDLPLYTHPAPTVTLPPPEWSTADDKGWYSKEQIVAVLRAAGVEVR
jgi:hypothetical protein